MVTDFVANCGGVLGSILDRELDGAAIWHILNTAYRQKITELVATSLATEKPICSLARGEVEERFTHWHGPASSASANLGRRLRKVVPRRMRAAYHQRFYEVLWRAGGRGDGKTRH